MQTAKTGYTAQPPHSAVDAAAASGSGGIGAARKGTLGQNGTAAPFGNGGLGDAGNGSVTRNGSAALGYRPEPPVTIPFDYSYAKGSDDLPIDRPPLAKTVSDVEPEQIHIALAGGYPFLVLFFPPVSNNLSLIFFM
jgi:hypothetical protein